MTGKHSRGGGRATRNRGKPDDFPLTVSVNMNGDGNDGGDGVGLPGSAPPPTLRMPDDENDSGGASSGFDDDSHTALNRNSERNGESVRFQDEEQVDEGGGNAGVKDKFQRQYRNVRWIKFVVILLLVITAVVVTWAVFFFTRNDEQGDFKLEYENLADKVVDSFTHNMDMKVYTAYTLSGSFATYRSIDSTTAWPNMTIPGFVEMTLAMPLLAHSWSIGFSPMVTSETRKGWEAYTTRIADQMGLNEIIASATTMDHGQHGASGHGDEHHSAADDHGGHAAGHEMGKGHDEEMTSEHEGGGMNDHIDDMSAMVDGEADQGGTKMNDMDHHQPNGGRRALLRGGRRTEGTTNLQFIGFGVVSRLGHCQGDCNSDEDCRSDLVCLKRTSRAFADTLVTLGCTGNPVAPVDYCVDLMKMMYGNNDAKEGEGMAMDTGDGMDHGDANMSHEAPPTEDGDAMHQADTSEAMEHGEADKHQDMDDANMHQDESMHHGGGDMPEAAAGGYGDHHVDEVAHGNKEGGHDGGEHDEGGWHGDDGHGDDRHDDGYDDGPRDIPVNPRKVEDGIFKMHGREFVDEDDLDGPYFPLWQVSPLEDNAAGVMFNQYSVPEQKRAIDDLMAENHPTLTEVLLNNVDYHADDSHHDEPSSTLFYPVGDINDRSTINGITSISFTWTSMLMNVLPSDISGMVCVLESSTGQAYTFELNGKKSRFVGEGDLHDKKYDSMMKESKYQLHGIDYHLENHHMMDHRRALCDKTKGRRAAEGGHEEGGGHSDDSLISYTLKTYPSDTFKNKYITREPMLYAIAIALVFIFTSMTFFIYDCLVERRQTAVMQTAEKSSKIVHSLFPAVVRDRLFSSAEEELAAEEEKKKSAIRNLVPKAVSNIVENSAENNFKRTSVAAFLGKESSSFNMGDDSTVSGNSPPIADLFTDTTILFADIAGFTAWSSEREPAQVFQLLEALFKEFDTEAKKHGVFKVETIGDCYVAVTGLPNPRADHAVAMSRFAQNCLLRFHDLTNELELSLGPGTAELGLRVGLHSGPVTAGVLRGEKSRFQLFGDTMNTASRMESTGQRNMIQVSQQTADLLVAAGKGRYLAPREDLVNAKGKGTLQTYWILPRSSKRRSSNCGSQTSYDSYEQAVWSGYTECPAESKPAREQRVSFSDAVSQSNDDDSPARSDIKKLALSRDRSMMSVRRGVSTRSGPMNDSASWKDTGIKEEDTIELQPSKLVQRLIKWNTQVLEKYLVKVILHRSIQKQRNGKNPSIDHDVASALFSDEVAEAVEFRHFDRHVENQFASIEVALHRRKALQFVTKEGRDELLEYVSRIASMYKNVHFHNFEHASHVTMSASKLMNKVCSRDSGESNGSKREGEEKKSDSDASTSRQREASLFFSTFGISSDPLAQLSVVFAALVHDVDHTGVPNTILVGEKPDLGAKYNNRSVAENNSIHVAWSVLMEPRFENLRGCMFGTDDDRDRFRQLLINVVIATDIADRERKAKEQARWQRAFEDFSTWDTEWENKKEKELAKVDVSLKATVVLEQIVLASDVAHTMQHWLTFVKWNERLYRELWAAYVSGRASTDPTIGWYEGQIGFFDGYIIPLATKLKECGVFGSAGEEYLGNALSNREEWIEKGKEISTRFEETIRNAESGDSEPNYWTSH